MFRGSPTNDLPGSNCVRFRVRVRRVRLHLSNAGIASVEDDAELLFQKRRRLGDTPVHHLDVLWVAVPEVHNI